MKDDRRYVWDVTSENILAELDGAGNVLACYTPTRTQDDVIVKENHVSNKTAIYSDFNKNLPTEIVRDEFGNKLEERDVIEPFGAILDPNAATNVDHVRYMGKMQDPVTGLFYFRHRWFDAQARRFVSPDPQPFNVFNPQTTNLYVAFGDNPVQNVDPTGMITTAAEALLTTSQNTVTVAQTAVPKPRVTINITVIKPLITFLTRDIKKADEIFDQAGIDVLLHAKKSEEDTNSLDLDQYTSAPNLTAEEEHLLGLNRSPDPIINMYYVDYFVDPPGSGTESSRRGESMPPYLGFSPPKTGIIVSTRNSNKTTFAHELGHMLGLQHPWETAATDDDDPENIMSYNTDRFKLAPSQVRQTKTSQYIH